MRTEEEIRERYKMASIFAESKQYSDCKTDFEMRELIRVRNEQAILEWVLNEKEGE